MTCGFVGYITIPPVLVKTHRVPRHKTDNYLPSAIFNKRSYGLNIITFKGSLVLLCWKNPEKLLESIL